MATTDFKIEEFDTGNDEMAGYEKVKIEAIIGKPFIVEKVTIQDDKHGHSMNVAFDMDGDKLFIYTTSKRLVSTMENVLKAHGSMPAIPIKIETEMYANSTNPAYKFVSA